HPGEFVLGSTYELVTLPDDVAARLVLCGGSVMGDEPEARILARFARDELGYAGAVVLEEASTSTRENVANAIPLIEDADTIRIVSDPVHAAEAAASSGPAHHPHGTHDQDDEN
ncbi:YdcF family protein, partial [Clavibacter lycopersici]|uniref:YdcF family protein n=1 Tax=Clavibacter lycopersici TaxID=2301718 RepID=UPI001F2E4EE9